MYDHNVTQSEFEKVIDFLRSTQVPPEFFRSNLLLMLEKHFDYSVSSLWLVGSQTQNVRDFSCAGERSMVQ